MKGKEGKCLAQGCSIVHSRREKTHRAIGSFPRISLHNIRIVILLNQTQVLEYIFKCIFKMYKHNTIYNICIIYLHIIYNIYTHIFKLAWQRSLWIQLLLDQPHSWKNSQTCLFLHTRATERTVTAAFHQEHIPPFWDGEQCRVRN